MDILDHVKDRIIAAGYSAHRDARKIHGQDSVLHVRTNYPEDDHRYKRDTYIALIYLKNDYLTLDFQPWLTLSKDQETKYHIGDPDCLDKLLNTISHAQR